MSRKIATLWDKKPSDDANTDHQAQAFYAGGSEHSGQQILGPNRDRPEPNQLIESIFNHARQSAATVQDPAAASSSSTITITMWRNGFTIGPDGELRQYDTPDSREFLDCLRRGETPQELASRVRGGMVDVKLENKAQEEYKPVRRPFTGKGYRLGAPTPELKKD